MRTLLQPMRGSARAVITAVSLLTSLAALAQGCPGAAPAASAEALTLRAVGDIVLGSDWPKNPYPEGFEALAEERLRAALGAADVIFGNFEGALTTHAVSTKVPRAGAVFAIRMPPSFANLLRRVGFDAFHISNNHTYDFGETGFRDTLAHLTQAGIRTVGEREQVTVQTVKGITLAWVGFSYTTRQNVMHDAELLAALVGAARARADLVVVSIQAGAEGTDALRVVDREENFLGENRGNVYAFAHRAVDLGADLVLGHGPHVLRGMECYKGRLIAYSLGNFVGYGVLSTRRAAALSIVLEVTLAKDRSLRGFDVRALRFDEDRFPRADPDQLARYLINDLSGLAPLDGSVRLAVPAASEEAYRAWLEEAGLRKVLAAARVRR